MGDQLRMYFKEDKYNSVKGTIDNALRGLRKRKALAASLKPQDVPFTAKDVCSFGLQAAFENLDESTFATKDSVGNHVKFELVVLQFLKDPTIHQSEFFSLMVSDPQ